MVKQVDPNDPVVKDIHNWEKKHKAWFDKDKPKKKSFIKKHWRMFAIGGGCFVLGCLAAIVEEKLTSGNISIPLPSDDMPEWIGRDCILKGIVEKTGEELMSVPCSERFIQDMIAITSEYSDTL